jgi:SpoVK/Ycf46/Vps4 family AAA+-type ATPase
MTSRPDPLQALRDALQVSPDNVPLRQHLAQSLLGLGRYEEAEQEFRQALALAPGQVELRLGLAQAYLQQGKNSHALVVVEDLLKQSEPPPRAYVLHSRLLLRAGDANFAATQYKEALRADASLEDAELSRELGIRASELDRGPFSENPFADDRDDRLRAPRDDMGEAPDITVERPQIRFADVGGMDALKEEIRMKIIYPLEHAEMFRAYGKAIGGGILMYGPPGCGKTYLARATAGEIDAGFISIGINDVLDMWIGSSERNLHELFEQARRSRPCVLFFDEVDALGASRSDMRQSAGRQLINQFLAELDGADATNDGVLILAATNAPWHLDAAFRRPGRFDRILFVPPPDAGARAAVLRILCRGKPVQDIDYEGLAKKTDNFSGADLKALVDVAIEGKLREAMKSGKPEPLATRDLAAAAKTMRPTTREWFASARNYALYANQGGLYDPILSYLDLKR